MVINVLTVGMLMTNCYIAMDEKTKEAIARARKAVGDMPIIVDASCCAGVTPESHKNALEAMKCCQVKIENE